MLLIKLYNYFNTISFKIGQLNNIKQIKINNKPSILTPFISSTVKKQIHRMNYKVTFNLQSRNINYVVNIYHKKEDIDSILINLIYLLSFISYFCKSNKKIYINYYLTDLKKHINIKKIKKSSKTFTINEVNSGSCYDNKIHIWRKEEIFRVTIHELIHAFQIENIGGDPTITEKYNKRFNFTMTDVNIREAYTEFWSLLLHTYFYTRLTNNTFQSFQSNLNKEIKFSYYQYSKIVTLSSKDINKYTNIFAYYILKYELLKNLNSVLLFSFKNNKNLIEIINIPGFYDLIYLFRKNKVKDISIKDDYFKTMRMTILDIN